MHVCKTFKFCRTENMGCSVSWKTVALLRAVAHGYELWWLMKLWHGSLENKVALGGVVAVFIEKIWFTEKRWLIGDMMVNWK